MPQAKKTIKTPDGGKEIIVLIEDSEDFERKWKAAFSALKRGFAILRNSKEFGAIKSKFLPYHTIVPIFSTIHEHIRRHKYDDMPGVLRKIRLWYWSNVFLQNYLYIDIKSYK